MNFKCKANKFYLPLTLTGYIFKNIFWENLTFILNILRPIHINAFYTSHGIKCANQI